MLDWWDKYRDRMLAIGVVAAFLLLLVVKIKLDVPSYMKSPEWSLWVAFFRSDAFEDVAGDLLVGFIAAYFFYVLIDLIPRRNRDRKAKILLSTLLSSHLETFLSGEMRAHARQINEFGTLKSENIDKCNEMLNGEKDAKSYQAVAHMSMWSHQRISDSLQVALSLGIEQGQLWLEITDTLSKMKYLAEGADSSGILKDLRTASSQGVVIKDDPNSAIGYWAMRVNTQFKKLVGQSDRWLRLSGL